MAYDEDALDVREVYESICFARPYMYGLKIVGFRQTKTKFFLSLQSDAIRYDSWGFVKKSRQIMAQQKAMREAGY